MDAFVTVVVTVWGSPMGILCWLNIGPMLGSIGLVSRQHPLPDGEDAERAQI